MNLNQLYYCKNRDIKVKCLIIYANLHHFKKMKFWYYLAYSSLSLYSIANHLYGTQNQLHIYSKLTGLLNLFKRTHGKCRIKTHI